MVVIAISGLSGTGKTTVAKMLAERLNIDYFSVGQLFKKLSKEKGEIACSLDVWRGEGKKKYFHHKLDILQQQMARNGNVIIDGKISIFILKNISCFKVWLTAEPQVRIERVAKKDNLPLEKAKKLLELKERYEAEIWKKIYGISLETIDSYADVVIDTTNLPIEEIVNKIIRIMPK